jgi:transcriptional regulator with XRE-family HTH domain
MATNDTYQVASWFKDEFDALHQDPTFITEEIVLDLALQIAEAMEEAGIETQKELAERLDVSPSAVSQLLSGDQNVSIHRLVKVALALGKTVEAPKLVEFEPPNVEVRARQHGGRVDLDGVQALSASKTPWRKARPTTEKRMPSHWRPFSSASDDVYPASSKPSEDVGIRVAA